MNTITQIINKAPEDKVIEVMQDEVCEGSRKMRKERDKKRKENTGWMKAGAQLAFPAAMYPRGKDWYDGSLGGGAPDDEIHEVKVVGATDDSGKRPVNLENWDTIKKNLVSEWSNNFPPGNPWDHILFVDDTKENVRAVDGLGEADLGGDVKTVNTHIPKTYGNLDEIEEFILKERGKNTLVLLDFDQTLIPGHTMGYPDLNHLLKENELRGRPTAKFPFGIPGASPEELRKLAQFLKKLTSDPDVTVGIVTRGVADDVQKVINHVLSPTFLAQKKNFPSAGGADDDKLHWLSSLYTWLPEKDCTAQIENIISYTTSEEGNKKWKEFQAKQIENNARIWSEKPVFIGTEWNSNYPASYWPKDWKVSTSPSTIFRRDSLYSDLKPEEKSSQVLEQPFVISKSANQPKKGSPLSPKGGGYWLVCPEWVFTKGNEGKERFSKECCKTLGESLKLKRRRRELGRLQAARLAKLRIGEKPIRPWLPNVKGDVESAKLKIGEEIKTIDERLKLKKPIRELKADPYPNVKGDVESEKLKIGGEIKTIDGWDYGAQHGEFISFFPFSGTWVRNYTLDNDGIDSEGKTWYLWKRSSLTDDDGKMFYDPEMKPENLRRSANLGKSISILYGGTKGLETRESVTAPQQEEKPEEKRWDLKEGARSCKYRYGKMKRRKGPGGQTFLQVSLW